MKIKNKYLVYDERTLHGDCTNKGNSVTMLTKTSQLQCKSLKEREKFCFQENESNSL